MTKRRGFGLLAVCLAMVGCQSTTTTTMSTPSSANNAAAVPFPVDRPATPNEAVASAPSAVRLTNLEDALLMYYVDHQRLPQMLEELKALPGGAALQLTSPESGQPYVYSQDGLLLAGSPKRIIVWDPVAGKNGKRWCILMPRADRGSPVSLELVELPEAAFRLYVPTID